MIARLRRWRRRPRRSFEQIRLEDERAWRDRLRRAGGLP